MDTTIKNLTKKEDQRQQNYINLIPSENYASKAVRETLASRFMNKYSEGYPGARYYPGNEYVDEVEKLAQERSRKLFRLSKKWGVNVQPYSGTPANLAIYTAILGKNGTALAMKLDHGGHLSHGHPITASGKFFKFFHYGVDKTGYIDYKVIAYLAKKHRPKLIVSGTSAYSRKIDYTKIKKIARRVGAFHMTDMAHIAGLVAGGALPSPFPWCDIVMTTTHKTLRGPRGAIIFAKNHLMQEINKGVFPGIQGGPHDNQTAAITVALKEAASESFRRYSRQVVKNAKVLARELTRYGFILSSGGTDNHLVLVDMRKKNLTGKQAETLLYTAGIVVNRNAIPHDPRPPYNPSGIRLGAPAVTTRRMKEKEMVVIAKWIKEVLHGERLPETVRKDTLRLARRFPIP